MKSRSFVPLGEAEMELLQHVWSMGKASVSEVHARVLEDREVAYTTVMTILRRLVDKGYLRYEKEGNAFVYSARQNADSVRGSVLGGIIDKVFRGSPVELVQTLTRQEDLSQEDLDEIRKLIDGLGETGDDRP